MPREPRQPLLLRVFYVVAGVGLVFAVGHACAGSSSGSTTGPPGQTTSIVRATAVLTHTHSVNGREVTHHDAMTGDTVTATAANQRRFTGTVDQDGVARLRLPTGNYILTESARDACPPLSVMVEAPTPYQVDLKCVAP